MPRQRFQRFEWRHLLQDPHPTIIGWMAGAMSAILIPAVMWHQQRYRWYNTLGYGYQYQAAAKQNQQEQQQQYGAEQYNYYYHNCGWWQWGCRLDQYSYATQTAGNGGENNIDLGLRLPNWFILLGGETEDMRNWQYQNTGVEQQASELYSPGVMKFVYAWTMIMFLTMVGYGAYSLKKKLPASHIITLVTMFLQVCVVECVMCMQGKVISTEDEVVRTSTYGWYGQTSVLVITTAAWYIIFCLCALLFFSCKITFQKQRDFDEGEKIVNGVEYRNYTESDKKIGKSFSEGY